MPQANSTTNTTPNKIANYEKTENISIKILYNQRFVYFDTYSD